MVDGSFRGASLKHLDQIGVRRRVGDDHQPVFS